MEARDKLFYKANSREEYLPGYMEEFPCISSYVTMDKYPGKYVPWHWHNTVEFFYVKSGTIEYHTSQGKIVFTRGMGGIINADVLHMAKVQPESEESIVLVHLFEASFLAGEKGSLIDKKYVQPILAEQRTPLIALSPENEEQAMLLKLLETSFSIDNGKMGYEIYLRNILSEIWMGIYCFIQKNIQTESDKKECRREQSNVRLKQMMLYIQEHYAEKITVAQVANAAFLSERACFRLFRDCLHVTPAEYMRNYRLQMACRMLEGNEHAIGEIGEACGLGSNSYFGKIFKEEIGCTPLEYRYKTKWRLD